MDIPTNSLLRLLQLASPALPVGAYSYSEGLEALVEQGIVNNKESLSDWITQELSYGTIRVETAVMLRVHACYLQEDWEKLNYWNAWLSATRETQELRQQSWQMGQSLIRLLADLHSLSIPVEMPCNYAVAYGIASAVWEIPATVAGMGYLHSWVTNLMNAGVKLIPLGQTAGQDLLHYTNFIITEKMDAIASLGDDDLESCSWGLALASLAHEVQYTRLFRS